ncbi:hypothetical protein AMECASPLE_011981 [Ameca splendens]|uniref:Uncharacterized protein n=1 Tax=Ameca splendens TaxID=208324 RepID=A0ABV0XPV8_9TELE
MVVCPVCPCVACDEPATCPGCTLPFTGRQPPPSPSSFMDNLPLSIGVGVKGTAFPAGTVKSLARGSNQTQTSK